VENRASRCVRYMNGLLVGRCRVYQVSVEATISVAMVKYGYEQRGRGQDGQEQA
jgi:hypothetical protein